MSDPRGTGLVFITGTDTGVGKTTLAALLLCHLRQNGRRVLAMKPFCSGGRKDAELLLSLQDKELSLDEINPFHFPEPLAPLVAARKHRREVPMRAVLRHIDRMGSRLASEAAKTESPFLLLEGAGGLLAPLGERYSALDLIKRLSAPFRGPSPALQAKGIVVSRNSLGTINHTLLTVQALRNADVSPSAIGVVQMNTASPDSSSRSNPRILRELLAPVPLFSLPFLGPGLDAVTLPPLAGRLRRTLGAVLGLE